MSYRTILFAIPRVAMPTFVASLHDSTSHPISVCRGVGWLKKPEAEQGLLWFACAVLPEQQLTSPDGIYSSASAFWKLSLAKTTIPSSGSIEETTIPAPMRQSWAPGLGKRKGTMPIYWPGDLREVFKSEALHDNPVMTVSLFPISNSGSRDKFEKLVEGMVTALRSMPKVEICAIGSISDSVGTTAGPYTEALVLRYSSIEEYVITTQSGWWDQLVKVHDLESIMEDSALFIMQEFVLAEKGVELATDDEGWPFGNPYEPLGEDWFG